jgi:AP-1-like factor
VELREYRKRLSWMSSGNGFSTANALQNVNSRSLSGGLSNNEFIFDFPKFGDLPASHIFNNGTMKDGQNKARDSPSSAGASPATKSKNASDRGPISNPGQSTPKMTNKNQISGFANGAPSGYRNGQASRNENISGPNTYQHQAPASSSASNTDSPSASSESQHGHVSSIGTSPEPSLNSPSVGKTNENGIEGHGDSCTHNTANGEKSFCDQLNLACGNINNPVPVAMNKSNNKSQLPGQQTSNSLPEPSISLDWLTQQNGGNFDPVLFNDYRESQDAILSQDFGTFFNDAFPLPDLGSPFHNFNDVTSPPIQQLQKKDLIAEIDNKLDEDDEVVPGEDQAQMLSCTKIWYAVLCNLFNSISTEFSSRDRLQSMEKFRNGEIDVDSLCTELRTKARCSEGGVVVDQKDVEDIMGRASTTQ